MSIKPDWSREKKDIFQWCPSISLLASIRSYQRNINDKKIFAKIYCKFYSLRYRFWSVVTGSDIDRESNIEGGLILPHPNGVVIHKKAVVGANCMIMQQVTIGQLAEDVAPCLGSNVYIGAGAKILGNITIGDNVNIGANAVVINDIPDSCTAVGIPAKIIKK